ncbi:MAG TPA: UDP-N-acetylmuramoyl-L-alanyl-D-glutamate--2,6-diaminopimelate ligase [Chloroflexota bacterium]|nr:UDP-N-acetylmuramoyl-L-alanyl-D-glutamate--2,6-diaminopimelate ligase [Chloroflexota bacterium]
MLLSDVLPEAPAVEVAGVAYDSRQVRPGYVFVAMPRVPEEKAPGDHRDGHDFLPAAAANGAAAAVVERLADVDLPQVVVPSTRQALADVAARFYGLPAARLRLLGVTGTDGKTTTVQLVSQVLEHAGKRNGFATTTDFKVGDRQWENLTRQTTVEALEVQELLRQMVDAGCSHAVLEATSQGLEQERLRGCEFDVAAVTNVTSDHMDWHKTRENYLAAKRRLFQQLRPSGAAVLNVDDESLEYFRAAVPGRTLTYGIRDSADFRATDVGYWQSSLVFRLHGPDGHADVELALLGRFNAYNALAAAAMAYAEGLTLDQIADGLRHVRPSPGRMERIDAGQPFRVLVDYAHTPNSFENVLTEGRALAEASGGRMLVVFGCSGERDRSKRPIMGATAARLADFFVLTDEDPHSEDPRQIVAEIEAGAADGHYVVEMDRRQAMALAFSEAKPGDVVLITGKGHERSMLVTGDQKIPWDERGIVREELERLTRRPAVSETIRKAIISEHQVIATYKRRVREMCPHAIGTKSGKPQALFYQFAGSSESGLGPDGSPRNWRCIPVDELSEVSTRLGPWHTVKADGHSKVTSCLDSTDLEWWADVALPKLRASEQG